MALTLHVQRHAWEQMVTEAFAAFPGLIPVVKGNGYGFGRNWLAAEAVARGAKRLAVGTVFELDGVGDLDAEFVVLTPSLDLDAVGVSASAVLTVASDHEVDHLERYRPHGPVTLKLRTTMNRHGVPPERIEQIVDRLRSMGADVRSISLHPPHVGSDDDRLRELDGLIGRCPPGLEVSVSHLGGTHFAELRATHPNRPISIRLGSALWHGDKRAFSLTATALDVQPVPPGTRVGYRGVEVPGSGSVVIVDAGTAHGVHPLVNGDSPFHFGRRRLALLEPPHMHVSLAWVPDGEPAPQPGDPVDVQRPLITTAVDRILWH